MKKHYRVDQNCLNCGVTVTDKFCPNCGQENLELREDFLHLVLHSVGHYFHFESKFFNSLVPLFTKPGYLTKEYFAGRRASHLNPISLYIFISILFFFLFTLNSNSKKKDIIKEQAAEENTITKAEAEQLKTVVGNAISQKAGEQTYAMLGQAQAISDAAGKPREAAVPAKPGGTGEDDSMNITVFGSKDNVVSNSLQTKIRTVMDDDLKRELFKNKLVSHLPKMMFILLPLFALILKLVSYRSKKYYVEHLIYSIHVHSFLFLFGAVLIVLDWILPFFSDWIELFGLVVIFWYIYRSMRNIYRSSRWRTIYKFFLLAFAYSFLMLLSGTIVALATLYTM
ncbi:DUF3667 domain-containing protein [Pontibacter sp. BT731]|uniref:DUF3667 domain-containing protein n=1 Tax=Pontibacter coccineus TaxID=3063328 RepID=UPI0026E3A13E|nr:DUF3667 domain-containing protein [Pontibacter sp. BT731]MDO6390426.1 DUF3667 domain-containing protein [Pontibacter sp. BT731]